MTAEIVKTIQVMKFTCDMCGHSWETDPHRPEDDSEAAGVVVSVDPVVIPDDISISSKVPRKIAYSHYWHHLCCACREALLTAIAEVACQRKGEGIPQPADQQVEPEPGPQA